MFNKIDLSATIDTIPKVEIEFPSYETNMYTAISHSFGKYLCRLLDLSMENGPWLAGGILQKLYHNNDVGLSDWDIWFKNLEQYKTANSILLTIDNTPIRTQNACTYSVPHNGQKYKVQLIKTEFFNNAQQVIDYFDFTVCQIATDGINMLYGNNTIKDLNKKRLSLVSNNVKNTLLMRLVKYVAYGYHPTKELISSIENKDKSYWAKNGEY